jgi:hypothetical protein
LKSWPRGLLLFVSLLLLGAGEPKEHLQLRVLAVAYPDTFAATASLDEVDNVWREVTEATEFVRRSSDGRLQLDVERVVVERVVPRDDFQEVAPGSYWLNDQVGGGRAVEDDLLALGRQPDQYDVVAVFYAWENRPSHVSEFGAASIGVNRILGKATYLAVPMAWNPSSLDEYFAHELLHCLESIFEQAGHPHAVPFLHNGWAFEAAYGGDQRTWYAWVLAHIAYQDYLARPGPWGTIVRGSQAGAP